MKIIVLISFLVVISCQRDSQTTELGQRFVKDVLSDLTTKNCVIVFTPSDCASCIEQAIEIISIINKSNKPYDFAVLSTNEQNLKLKKYSSRIQYVDVSATVLQRYGHLGNLGVLYVIDSEKEHILKLDKQHQNINIVYALTK